MQAGNVAQLMNGEELSCVLRSLAVICDISEVSFAVSCGSEFNRSQQVLIRVFVYMPFSELLFL